MTIFSHKEKETPGQHILAFVGLIIANLFPLLALTVDWNNIVYVIAFYAIESLIITIVAIFDIVIRHPTKLKAYAMSSGLILIILIYLLFPVALSLVEFDKITTIIRAALLNKQFVPLLIVSLISLLIYYFFHFRYSQRQSVSAEGKGLTFAHHHWGGKPSIDFNPDIKEQLYIKFLTYFILAALFGLGVTMEKVGIRWVAIFFISFRMFVDFLLYIKNDFSSWFSKHYPRETRMIKLIGFFILGILFLILLIIGTYDQIQRVRHLFS